MGFPLLIVTSTRTLQLPISTDGKPGRAEHLSPLQILKIDQPHQRPLIQLIQRFLHVLIMASLPTSTTPRRCPSSRPSWLNR
mgnify:CR=1 FL=1|jgi:hypothetical protein